MHNSVQAVLDTLALEDGAKRYDKDTAYKRQHQMITQAEWPLFREAFPVVQEALEVAVTENRRGPVQEWREVILSDKEVAEREKAKRSGKGVPEAELPKKVAIHNVTHIGLQIAFQNAISLETETRTGLMIGKLVYAQIREKHDEETMTRLGLNILNCVLACGLFQVVHPERENGQKIAPPTFIEFTEEAVKRMHDLEHWQRYMHPLYRPMVTKPRSVTEGSYLDSALASTVQMVKTMNKEQKAMIAGAVKADAKFVKACDIIQSVPLTVNAWIVPIIEKAYRAGLGIGSVPTCKLPEGNSKDDRKLRSQLKSQQAGFLTDLNEAKHYIQYDEVYLPATMDFRGRVYAKPHLNHQRADYVKAMFLFAEGKPLTYRGLEELKIHLANTGDFQKMSKAPFADRVKWVDENFPRIYETVQDPWSDLWWTEADSPFCFLAACYEYVQWFENPEGYICHLPIAIDGSCSGLQHYSAMLRDAVGAKSVNLVPTEQPEDVYKEVANIVNELVLQDKDDPIAQEWLAHKIDRKVTKRATMTLCYGSKQYGWREQLMEDFMNQYKKEIAVGKREVHPFSSDGKPASSYMAKKLDTALRLTVKAAVEGMDWLQDTSGLLAKENKPMVWTTPVGFPVVNGYYEPIKKQIDIVVKGRRYRNWLLLGYKDDLIPSKQRSTVAPNLVHSMDAAHLMMVAIQAKKEGINSMLLIHDSFGCLPSDMERFSEIVREQFVELYKHHDPFMAVHHMAHLTLSEKSRKKLTLPPAKGDLKIEDVVNSKYAFA